jgi:hypothetical protein
MRKATLTECRIGKDDVSSRQPFRKKVARNAAAPAISRPRRERLLKKIPQVAPLAVGSRASTSTDHASASASL